MRFLRSPLLHFVVLGWLLFAAQGLWSGAADADSRPPVHVTAAQVEQVRELARRETGREPPPEEVEYRIVAWVDDELMLREARAMGWHRTDPVVHMRLAQNLRFLGDGENRSSEIEETDAELVKRAYALGMDRSDVIVRRRLLERMRLAITSTAVANEPPDAELAVFLAADPERYRQPPLVKITHVFLSRDRRGDRLAADAAQTLRELIDGSVSIEAAPQRGDPSLIPADLPLSSERALASRLGPDFAAAAIALEAGGWRGPIASSYGQHLVWIERRIEARDPDVAEARRELLATWRRQTEREALRDALARLRDGVEITVDRPPAG